MNKLPATIILASLILGGFYYASQVQKQNSIEKQQALEIQYKKNKQEDIKKCMDMALLNYQFMWDEECKNANKEKDCRLVTRTADRLSDVLHTDEKTCINRYK